MALWKWILLTLSWGTLVAIGLSSPMPLQGTSSGCGCTSPIRGPNAIASLETVDLGGMPQWILIRGADRGQPVLLWLHGGPGSSQMPIARLTRDLESRFVVVHWDQRGAGKSNPQGFDERTMTLERFVLDAHELTGQLKERFGADSIYLLGHSWGTQIGIRLVQSWPEDYAAYIAVSQVVDHVRAEDIGYRWLQELARADGGNAVDRVERLGPGPYLEHERYVEYARLIESYGGGTDLGAVRLLGAALSAPEYCLGDYVAWFRGSARGSGPMWQETHPENLFETAPRIEVPIFFLSGLRDMNTPSALVQEYFDRLEAPSGKQLILFDGAAHTPFLAQPEEFRDVLFGIADQVQ